MTTVLDVSTRLVEERALGLHWADRTFGTLPDGHFSVVGINDHEYSLAPYPELGAMMYRGQAHFVEPCLPSLYRSAREPGDHLLAAVRVAEFSLVLADHPAVRDFSTWEILGLKPRIDYEALAQHYGLATGLLDFTSDPMVAAFFACTTYDYEKARYQPTDSSTQEGVMYACLSALATIEEPPSAAIVGLQPLPRPGEQYAWCYRVPAGLSLNTMPHVRVLRFQHDRRASHYIYDHFDGGEKLFPVDAAAAKADAIQQATHLSRPAFEIAREAFGGSGESYALLAALKAKGIEIDEDGVGGFADAELHEIESEWLARRDGLLSRIHYRRVLYV